MYLVEKAKCRTHCIAHHYFYFFQKEPFICSYIHKKINFEKVQKRVVTTVTSTGRRD